jgi:lauroyl/myristoyl acyltransferase/predicted RND superfamily exporter protein
MFGSPDGTFRLLFVEARPDLAGYQACESWLRAVQGIVAAVTAQQPEWRGAVVHYTGRPAFVAEIAGGMQRDLTGSIIGTAVIIAFLFWLTHRRWLPMIWLLTLLSLILLATLGLGGLILGTINVVSMGFAAVLLGLAVDYAVVHYQEALAHPNLSVPAIRRGIAPSILWAAITTISAFLVLNLGGLPGLAQLGTLVAIGVGLAAIVMVLAFLPPLFPQRRKPASALPPLGWLEYLVPPRGTLNPAAPGSGAAYPAQALVLTSLLLIGAGAVLTLKRPGLDKSADALKPQHAEAEKALDEMSVALGLPQNPLWLIVEGTNESQVYAGLRTAEQHLNPAISNKVVSGYLLPTALWPRPENQQSNRPTAQFLGTLGPTLREKALEAGFNTNALSLTDQMVETWKSAAARSGVFWPSNEMSRWLLNRFVARSPNQWLALGLVYPATNRVESGALVDLAENLKQPGILLSGWDLLGTTTLQRVRQRLWQVVGPMIFLVLFSLGLTFRRSGEVLLGLGVLCLSGFSLLAVMALAGWSWNLLNLMALPLMLGTGVDYVIFMQLALRRYAGDLALARRAVGRALLLCGGTAIAGFGSLAWSGNAGMASLGKVCAVGIAANMLIAVFLLPAWWTVLRGGSAQRTGQSGSSENNIPSQPSSFYRVWLWRLGLIIGRYLPRFLLEFICVSVAELYYLLHRARRRVVRENLLPALNGDQHAASKVSHALFRQFGLKMADLWRVESGRTIETRIIEHGWQQVEEARQRGRGVLLISAHLGNWEIGGPLLVKRGVPFLVITQAEPGSGFTEMRSASRARWGVETLVIGNDAFAFVEVIKRLQQGAIVALLVDRPPPPGAVTVELFGRPFRASVSAAELARASGCSLVAVAITRTRQGYLAQIQNEIVYDRQALGNREARRQLTQEILRALEPAIRQHPDQWFHFVPIWPES